MDSLRCSMNCTLPQPFLILLPLRASFVILFSLCFFIIRQDCIYENENGLPGKILDHAKIILEIPIKNNKIIADLSSLKIKVPTNGYFIGFEWIYSKENIINGTQTDGPKPYNPAISGIQIEKPNLFFFDRNWQKDKEQLSSSLKIDVDYLPEN